MLRIHFGITTDMIYDSDDYFDGEDYVSWLSDPMVEAMIEDVDRSKHIKDYIIESPILGGITPTQLSGGLKTLILVKMIDNEIFNASNCGDNCAKWLLEITKDVDRTVSLGHIMDFGPGPYEIYIDNLDRVVHNNREYVVAACEAMSPKRGYTYLQGDDWEF